MNCAATIEIAIGTIQCSKPESHESDNSRGGYGHLFHHNTESGISW